MNPDKTAEPQTAASLLAGVVGETAIPRVGRHEGTAASPGAGHHQGATPVIQAHVTADISAKERWEHFRCRVSSFREHYTVPPGLYAFGKPNADSAVLASANYKLSFDALRQELTGLDAWIVVLDTKGINVWCAAGKGTFGTDELVRRISSARLDRVVNHHRLVVPQLGAVGVCAREVRKRTGFRVSFGPVRAADIPAYIEAGYRKTPWMSEVRFSTRDRIVLTPMELSPALKKLPWFAALALLAFGIQRDGIMFAGVLQPGVPFVLLGLAAVIAGAFLTPLLLPWIPFRSFAIKGFIIGLIVTLLASLTPFIAGAFDSRLLRASALVIFPAASSYIALQFTGSTTFTGMSGVKKELRFGLPLYAAAAAAGFVLIILFKLTDWGIL